MTLLADLTPLLPTDEQRAASREALVAELRAQAQDQPTRHPAPAPRRSRAPRRLALPAVAAAGMAVAVIAVARPGGPDIVAEAEAAAAVPHGSIVHVVTRAERIDGLRPEVELRGGPRRQQLLGTLTGRVERWSSDDPFRVHEVQDVQTPTGGSAAIQSVRSASQILSRTTWMAKTQTTRLTGDPQTGGTAGGGLGATAFSTDPLTSVRALLRSDELRADGTIVVRGRTVRRLVGRQPAARGDDAVDFEYLVDAGTYAPVRISAWTVSSDGSRRLTGRWVFERYERLPLTAETRGLLSIDETR